MNSNVFVGRDVEITRLEEILDEVVKGKLSICLLAGDPGDGKTTLVEQFAESARKLNERLDYAIGTCDIETGKIDMYDPFRDIFAQLAGIRAKTVESMMTEEREFNASNLIQTSTEMLLEFAPELIGTLIPGAALLSKIALSATDKIIKRRIQVASDVEGKIEHEEIRKQSKSFFEKRTSNEKPLILIFDDVQWIDQLSLELLIYLIRELDDSALFIVLSYRPSDLDSGENAGKIESVADLIAWIKMSQNCYELDLRESRIARGNEFIRQYLEEKNCDVSPEFVAEFYRRTDARPIFVVELFRFLQSKEVIVPNALGILQEVPSMLDWRTTPLRITKPNALIEDRFHRLDSELQEILKLASIEGFEFTAQVIVSITGMDERMVLRILSEQLGRMNDFVREVSEERVGNYVLSHFRFTNIWYQEYIYTRIGAGERRLLHSKVAQTLESLYGMETPSIVTKLAYHYELGRDLIKASMYLIEAATNLASNSQYDGAHGAYERALSLSREVNYVTGIIDALRLLAVKIYLAKSGEENYRSAEALLDESLPLAEEQEHLEAVSFVMRAKGRIHRYFGRYAETMYCYIESLRIATQINDKKQIAACFTNIGVLAKSQNRLDDASFYFNRRLDLADEMDDDEGRVISLMNLIGCLQDMGERNPEEKAQLMRQAEAYVARAKKINDELSNASREIGINTLHVRTLIDQGEYSQAATILYSVLAMAQQAGLFNRLINGLLNFIRLMESSSHKDLLVPLVLDFIIVKGDSSQRKTAEEFKEQAYSIYGENQVQSILEQYPLLSTEEVVEKVLKVLSVFDNIKQGYLTEI